MENVEDSNYYDEYTKKLPKGGSFFVKSIFYARFVTLKFSVINSQFCGNAKPSFQ